MRKNSDILYAYRGNLRKEVVFQGLQNKVLLIFLTPILLIVFAQGCQKAFQAESFEYPQATINLPSENSNSDSDENNISEEVPMGLVPMFVAVGRGGRTIVSCDDGKSWIGDRSIDENNADHSPTVDKGFAYGDGVFIQVMGWGYDAQIQRSEDGFNWEVTQFPYRLSALAFTGNQFLLYGNKTLNSVDRGKTWTLNTYPGHGTHAREGGGGGEPGGPSIVAIGSGVAPKFTMDEGQNWLRAPEACENAISFGGVGQRGGLTYGNKTFVVMDANGKFCTTSDFGLNWFGGQLDTVDVKISGKLNFTGSHFWALAGTKAYRSSDGKNWETITFSPESLNIHLVAKSAEGVYVGIDRASSSFYRSEDGVNWTFISTHKNGLSLSRLLFGYAKPSEKCN